MLFELDRERTDSDPGRACETTFEFLDRVSGPVWNRVRALLNDWVASLPATSHAHTISRLKSPEGWVVRSAYWEVYLFNLLRLSGAQPTPHPDVDGTTHKPDFLVEGLGQPFYLEARVLEHDEDTARREQQREEIWNGLNERLTSEHIFLKVVIDAYGHGQIPIGRLAIDVDAWLKSLNVDQLRIIQDAEGLDGLPSLDWEDQQSGWELELSPMVKTDHFASDRIVGMGGAEAGWKNDITAIRRALKKKYSRYGSDPGLPLVVALGVGRHFVDDTDVFGALLGDEVYKFVRDDPSSGYLTRTPNGVWCGTSGPRGQRLSAVIAGQVAQPWSVVEATGKLKMWINPWAQRPLEARVRSLDSYEPGNNEFQLRPADQLAVDVLGLPAEWPGPEPSFLRI